MEKLGTPNLILERTKHAMMTWENNNGENIVVPAPASGTLYPLDILLTQAYQMQGSYSW
jgi:hypothetical protein